MSRRLIEEWLPIAEIGIEIVRERTLITPFVAMNHEMKNLQIEDKGVTEEHKIWTNIPYITFYWG